MAIKGLLCRHVRGKAPESNVRSTAVHRVCVRAGAPGQLAPLTAQRFGLTNEQMSSILSDYWQARGIHDRVERRRLVGIATEEQASTAAVWDPQSNSLPGVETVWALKTPDTESDAKYAIQQVSARLLELAALLGVQQGHSRDDAGLDVSQMLLREPALLTADLKVATRCLLELRIKLPGSQDVSRILMQQPSLLLADFSTLQQTSLEQLLPALQHGLSSDLPAEWQSSLASLAAYVHEHGDAHCGFRDSDSNGLARWCRKQRSDFSKGDLSDSQIEQLEALQFEFNGDRAEWMRWYAELEQFVVRSAASQAADWEIQTAQKELYLTNWCAVQRIARRSGVLSEERVVLLDKLGFEWSGADPLS